MSPDNAISLELMPEEIRENNPDSFISSSTEDPQDELRRSVVHYLLARKTLSGTRDDVIEIVEEALLRHLMESKRYSQRELSKLLAMSRVTLHKKLARYRLL